MSGKVKEMANITRLEFEIDNGPEKYKRFIEKLRENLSDSISHEYAVPTAPSSWLDIHLISGSRSITLRIDPSNLYVRGISTGDGDFWEFSDSSLIPGSRRLTCPGILFGPAGALATCAPPGLRHYHPTPTLEGNHIPVGYIPLMDAIAEASTNPMMDQKSMFVIIQMTTEAVRMKLIAEHIFDHWFNPQPITLEIECIQRALGMGTFPSDRISSYCKFSSIITYKPGLLNLEYIRLKDNRNQRPVKIYGFVEIEDQWLDHFVVYNRSRHDPESITPGKSISLTSPSEEINGTGPFIIKGSLIANDDISHLEIVFEPILDVNSYDKNLEEEVSGKYGTLCVGYSILRRAYNATFKFFVINCHGESTADLHVFGRISASYLFATLEPARMQVLFDKSEDESVQVSPDQSIPLTRPFIPVPYGSVLTIGVDLQFPPIMGSSMQLVGIMGSLQFTPMIGTQVKKITTELGEEVQVFITCE